MFPFRYIVPNALTMLNLLCGIAAIISLFESQPERPYLPVVLLLCAAVFDVFDGLVAKILKATSEFGKQLDSLSDLVSFGVAPAIMLYKLLVMAFIFESSTASFLIENATIGQRLVLYSALLFAVFAALRLARFNLATTVSTEFVGMPVPAAALIVVSVWIGFHITDNETIQALILNKATLLALVVGLCYLMISEHKMLSLKFKGTALKSNLWQYLLLFGALVIIILFKTHALLLVMIYYILLSLVSSVITSKKA